MFKERINNKKYVIISVLNETTAKTEVQCMEAVTEYEAFITDQIITQTESWRKSYEER